jgi:hypothetical protein
MSHFAKENQAAGTRSSTLKEPKDPNEPNLVREPLSENEPVVEREP